MSKVVELQSDTAEQRLQNTLNLPGEVTERSLILPDNLEENEWQDIGRRLVKAGSSVIWWIGDWWAFGENHEYGSRKKFAEELEEEGGYSFGALRNAGSVSRNFEETSRRRDVLPWQHHAEVAALSPELQDEALDWAEEEKAKHPKSKPPTVRQMRGHVRGLKAGDKFQETKLPAGKFRVLYADPPWLYGNERPLEAGDQGDHYKELPLNEICNFVDIEGRKIQDLPLDDAVLFLWTTSAMLEDAFKVIKDWGFEYKTSFVWDKVKHNMGHYNSVRHEFLLVCGRGASTPDVRKLYDSVVVEERTEHSRKPDIFYDIIETLYPSGKKVEIFSRSDRKGWEHFGNE